MLSTMITMLNIRCAFALFMKNPREAKDFPTRVDEATALADGRSDPKQRCPLKPKSFKWGCIFGQLWGIVYQKLTSAIEAPSSLAVPGTFTY